MIITSLKNRFEPLEVFESIVSFLFESIFFSILKVLQIFFVKHVDVGI